MEICGLQKLAMVDYPGKLAATVFTGGCNLRCPFCHNALLVTAPPQLRESYSAGEVLDFLRSRRGLIDGVVISGGEPLLDGGAADFAAWVKDLGFSVKLDTNGCFPERLRAILETRAVDYVAMDIKSCLPKYPRVCGVPGLDTQPVQDSAALLLEGKVDYEFRTTLVREFHTEDDMTAIGSWLRGGKRYYLQKFVDSGGLIGGGLHPVPDGDMRAMAERARPFFGEVALRGVG